MTTSFYVENPYPMHGNHGGLYERELRQFFAPLAPRTILDAGCGTGAMSRQLARQFPDASIVAVDRSTASIEVARKRHKDIPNISFRVHDLEAAVPEHDDTFDFVFCQGVLHHMADPMSALRNIHTASAKEMTAYVWLYSEHGRVEIAQLRELLRLLTPPDATREEKLAVLELTRPIYRLLHDDEERELEAWKSDDPGWTRADERRARFMDRYINPLADHYSVTAAADLFRKTGFDITAVPTLDSISLEPALPQALTSNVPDAVERYSAMELVIRPWGIGYLLHKSRH
ncbi:class I SAM-dependent methyltransferase [Streptosporangium sp. KLBMP 9127]|nr:methyltransferase domain-containing protein [Streptosporangium sp. KLBMP 9127]